MEDSILETIKNMLGYGSVAETPFDKELVTHINSAFSALSQIGLGSSHGFSIKDESEKWSDIIPEGTNLELVKSYVYFKTKIVFDPPTSTAALDTMKELLKEYEFRISIEVDGER